jgi:hypothetical protein
MFNKFLRNITLSVILISICSAQSVSNVDDLNSKKLSRLHILYGSGKFDEDTAPLFIFSYHYSGFQQKSKGFGINLALEPGLIYLTSDSRGYFLPYLRISPELGFNNNFFINVNATGIFYNYTEGNTVIPFLGLSGNYLVYLNEDFALEFESGLNSSLFTYRAYTYYYFSIGIAFI